MSARYKFVAIAQQVIGCSVFREGDQFTVRLPEIVVEESNKFCVHVLSAFLPFLMAAEAGASFEDLELGSGDTALMRCVDVTGGVIFRVNKITLLEDDSRAISHGQEW